MPLPTIAGAFGNADAEFHLLEVVPGRSMELAMGSEKRLCTRILLK